MSKPSRAAVSRDAIEHFEQLLKPFFEMHTSGLSEEAVWAFCVAFTRELASFFEDSRFPISEQKRFIELFSKMLLQNRFNEESDLNSKVAVDDVFKKTVEFFVVRTSRKPKPDTFDMSPYEDMSIAEIMAQPEVLKKIGARIFGPPKELQHIADSVRRLLRYKRLPSERRPEDYVGVFKSRREFRPIAEILEGQWSGGIIIEMIVLPIVFDHALKLEQITKSDGALKSCLRCGTIFPSICKRSDAIFCSPCEETPQIEQRVAKKEERAKRLSVGVGN